MRVRGASASFAWLVTLAVAAGSMPAAAAPASTPATLSTTSPAATTAPGPTTEARTAQERALELERRVGELDAERVAIDTRIEVTTARILAQQDLVWQARQAYELARATYNAKLVAMYKARTRDQLTLLLEARSFSEMLTVAAFLAKVAEHDRRVVRDAAVLAAEADYEAAQLEDLKAEDLMLRGLRQQRLAEMQRALTDQKALVAALTADELKTVLEYRAAAKLTRDQWRAASVPLSHRVQYVDGVVEPYAGTWKVSEFHPTRYRATGRKIAVRTSWYGPGFHGRRAASGQIYHQGDLTCASRTLPFGTHIALTYKGKRVVVVVNDRGPYVPSDPARNLDLSAGARSVLGFWGVIDCEGEFVEPVP